MRISPELIREPKVKHICCECGKDKTDLNKVNGHYYQQWHKIEGNKFICKYCYNRNKEFYLKSKRKSQKKYRLNNPDKIKAQLTTNNKKLRLDYCEKCGIKRVRLEGHHFDYSKPNKIITLCIKCHKDIHNAK